VRGNTHARFLGGWRLVTVAAYPIPILQSPDNERVWEGFGSRLRTIRIGVAPSELVVKLALHNALPEFLVVGAKTNKIAKFIVEHQASSCSASYARAA